MDAMVTARMSQAKKEVGNAVLAKLGMNSSLAINKLYDYVIKYRRLPFDSLELNEEESRELQEEISWLDNIVAETRGEFEGLSSQLIRHNRLSTWLASQKERS